MKFYIIKKDQCVAAIPAQESILNEYQKKGFKFVEIIAARDENDALNRHPKSTINHKKWRALCTVSLLFMIILSIYTFIGE
ncbi:MAG: hypothetical protein ACPG5Z_06390 [Pseudoalteromonas sp.]|uniref:hypothetical protein n=1 Tax=unclassified Pseudoalteromonas TaxID=194690 RepID=UPI000C084FC5|nr:MULTISPECIES: hypothetical protein [unclassified Pseudoalteromonas]MDP2633317.1 hypothetical protein [Pseudoalteromonas sp. 1_MG-2023]PHN91712.1 hypothetical protein CSC79_01350 [Pseudoalteromonas sp. 3D05]TGE84792.1 hypothetical protein C7Y70_04400 [Pseudoalteromonas sp. KS88]